MWVVTGQQHHLMRPASSLTLSDPFQLILRKTKLLSDFIASNYLAGASLLPSLDTTQPPQKFINLILHLRDPQ